MTKLQLITDTGCDLPLEEIDNLPLELLPVTFTIEGKPCCEGIDFTPEQFYDRMAQYDKIHMHHIPAAVYLDRYRAAYKRGVTDVIVVTANTDFTGMYKAAVSAMRMFREQEPDSAQRMAIHVLDSKTYSLGYGYPVLLAAREAERGADAGAVIALLEDWFDSVEVYLTSFSMRNVPSDGALELLRRIAVELTRSFPIVRLKDGVLTELAGERGEQNTFERFVEHCRSALCELPDTPYLIASAKRDREAQEMARTLEAALGCPPVGLYKMGASTVFHSGRAAIALICKGKPRQ